MQLYDIEYVGHWGHTVQFITESQAELWRDGGATVKLVQELENLI